MISDHIAIGRNGIFSLQSYMPSPFLPEKFFSASDKDLEAEAIGLLP